MRELVELKMNVTVWALEAPDYAPCHELLEICDAIGAPRLNRSPAELYPTSNPISTCATDGSSRFLLIDTTGPKNGMEFVTVCVRCYTQDHERINSLLRSIRDRSKIAGALLDGDLGLVTPAHNLDGE